MQKGASLRQVWGRLVKVKQSLNWIQYKIKLSSRTEPAQNWNYYKNDHNAKFTFDRN